MSNLKPQILFDHKLTVLEAGRVPDGSTISPFEFTLPSKGLFESYHGVYINVSYFINVVCERGVMARTLQKSVEFVIEVGIFSLPV